MTTALVRDIAETIDSCELTHLERAAIDLDRARLQHEAYCQALEAVGCTLCRIAADHGCPDCVFIEDTLVVVPELAVLARPGARSRRAELPLVESAASEFRDVVRIEHPGTLDGGDVLQVGRRILVGVSGRTNRPGIDQLRDHLSPHGFTVEAIQFSGCLHLKSACTLAAPDRLLLNPAWVDPSKLGINAIEVDPTEPDAGNVLLVGDTLLADPRFPRTVERLQSEGINPRLVENSELAKAEAALTCCSVLLD
ncbi:MAG: arginine deiminase family protein [Phycisphaerales bacterium]|nr:arginine deiminase family protein [Phycisphaerales bacterium]